MSEKLVVTVIGNRSSGKSSTWNELFKTKVRTGTKLRKLYLSSNEYVEVFLVSGSPEERKTDIETIVPSHNPRIVLCSIQYQEHGFETIDYFTERGYFLFAHWLNPGYEDASYNEDGLELIPKILAKKSLLGIKNGKGELDNRTKEIREFIYGWAKMRNLLLSNLS
ncbi:MAG: hypothetical protein AB1589_28645 [Cyanobacteriota bacterium]